MGSKKKTKHDPSPSSSSTKRFSKLEVLAKSASGLGLSWEVPDFPQLDDQYLVSRCFQLRDFRFRFHLFSTGKASENAYREYLGLYLEIEGGTRGATGSVCCKVTMLNHIEGVVQTADKYVFRRYSTHGMKSNGQNEFSLFSSLQGFDSDQFLLNGTDLHIHGDILILDDEGSFVKVPLPQRNQRNVDVNPTDTIEGVCEGKFTWTLKNYSCLQERFKHNGMLASPPFPIGEALYQIHLESKKNPSYFKPGDENSLSMFLQGGLVNGEDKRLWCVLHVDMKNEKQRDPKKICTTCGRLGFDLEWTYLLRMSTFENPNNGWYKKEDDTVEFIVRFSAMKERFYITKELMDRKVYAEKTNTDRSNSRENKNMIKKEFTYCYWEILNFSRMAYQLNRINMRSDFCFRSRRISFGETGTHLTLYPWGTNADRDHVRLCLERSNSSKPPTTVEDERTALLLHFALTMHGLTRSAETLASEQIFRFHIDRAIDRHSDYNVRPEIYRSSSVGDAYDEPFVVKAHIRVLEETLELVDMKIRWEVENFISAFTRKNERIESNYVKISEGLRLCISIGDDEGEGILNGGLRSDRSLLVKSGQIYYITMQLAVLNQKNFNETQWNHDSFWVHENPDFDLGKLSDLLEEDAGYIVDDKVVFACNIIKCDSLSSIQESTVEVKRKGRKKKIKRRR